MIYFAKYIGATKRCERERRAAPPECHPHRLVAVAAAQTGRLRHGLRLGVRRRWPRRCLTHIAAEAAEAAEASEVPEAPEAAGTVEVPGAAGTVEVTMDALSLPGFWGSCS